MNYTEKYHLPQWKKEDRIMMEDFNRMCADMENGLAKTARDAAEGVADAAANAAEALSMAAQAAAAAAAAQTTANAAYSPSNQPYAVGTYVGTGAELAVNVGFQPRFLLISCADTKEAYLYTMAAGGGINSVRVEFTSTGFRVKKNYVDTSSSAQQIPYTNSIGTRYLYIAFR